jgi:hypothetical protein
MKTAMKILLPALILIGIALFYFFGFHTYFQNSTIQEELPFGTLIQESDSASGSDEEVTPQQTGGLAGELVRIDALHAGEGVVEWLELDHDKQFIRFNDVSIINGPDLYVYVSDQSMPGNTLASLGQYTDLGRLKANNGSMIYELPEIDHAVASVVIWCRRFGVLFTYATLGG